MKTILIYPPQWSPLNPHFSIASLAGQLRNNNYEVEIRDINIEFYNAVLTKNYLLKSIDKAFFLHDELKKYLAKEYSADKKEEDYTDNFKKNLYKYNQIKKYKQTRMSEIENIPEVIEESVSIMKCKTRFYNPKLLVEAINNIDKALEIVSLPYHPAFLEIHNYVNQFSKYTYESIIECCNDKSTNIYYEFLKSQVDSILKNSPDLIGVSINSSTQVVPGLTLCMMLRKKTNAHISIGGNFFGRVIESFEKHPEFFEIFADSILVEEGEKPVIELAKFIEGKISIDKVPNLVYLENNIVKFNEKIPPPKLNEIYFQDLTGFPLDLYFTPDIVLSTQSSRGCYWKQCSFCDHDFGHRHNIKDVDIFINEIKYLQEKFNISHFEFIDESISSEYLNEFSNRVKDEGLQISWFNNARLETAFNKEILTNASEAGLKMVLWGFESGSSRIMKLINKGIDIDKRLDILRDSIDSNIWNFAFIFFGFPTETREEAMQTIDTICKNTDVISSYGRSVFTLGKHTRLKLSPEKYSITEIMENKEEFSPSYEFKTSSGMDANTIFKMAQLCTEECNKAYNGPLWMYLRYREVLFLYICKFGAREVQNCKVQ